MFVIAEIGINHGGDPRLAKHMIRSAANAGADAVKFQAFFADDFEEPLASKLRPFQLRPFDYQMLFKEAEAVGIPFICSVFSEYWVDYLLEFVLIYKIASRTAGDLELVRYAAGRGKELLISFGMGDMLTAAGAYEAALTAGALRVTMLHCVSKYPTAAQEANLGRLKLMQAAGFAPIGYSDHTVGNWACFAAAALGATVIEKHFCIDRETVQNDDIAGSATPTEFLELVHGLKAIELGLGPPQAEVKRE